MPLVQDSNSLRSALSIATLVTYTIISQHSEAHAVDTATFFTAISVLAVVSDPLLIVAQRFGAIMAATASLARIQEFLLKEERQDTRLDAGENGSISGEGLSLGTKDLALLRDMNFALPRGSLTMVVGTVGSGKTTFLHGLMGEVDGTQGILRFPKAMSVGFCAQDAFLRVS
jgi:ABC-type transport system involved in cytochrome bd biosynthesis fused ATPase/permease subunit